MNYLAKLTSCVLVILAAAQLSTGQRPDLVLQIGHSKSVASVTFSPDGKTLASASDDNTIKLWDVQSGMMLRTLKGHSGAVWSIAFSPDGKILASGSRDATIRLWDVSTGAELKTLEGHSTWVYSVAYSPDGKILASVSDDNTIKLWNVSTGAELRTISHGATSVAFSPDGKVLASCAGSNIKLWDVSTGAELQTIERSSDGAIGSNEIAFSPDGKILAGTSGDMTKTIKLWDVSTGAELRTISHWAHSVAFSPDGKVLASTSGEIKLWDVSTGAELRTLKADSKRIGVVVFSPDGKTLATTSNRSIRLWDVQSGMMLPTFREHSYGFGYFALSPDEKSIAGGSRDNTIKLWDIRSGVMSRTLTGHSDQISSVAFSPDGKTLASGSYDKTIKLWHVSTGALFHTLKGHSYLVGQIAFSPDGKILASSSLDDTVRLWDVSDGTELRTLKTDSHGVFSIAFSPDGKILASGGADSTVKLWDVQSGQMKQTLSGHSNYVYSVAFAPDGKTLASASSDKTVRLWNAQSGVMLRTFTDYSDEVIEVAFSRDGRVLASRSGDTIKLLDASTGTVLRTLTDYPYAIYSIAFSSNNKYLLGRSTDTTIKLWDVSSGEEVASLITSDERDWMVITPDGLFDGSPDAWNQIIWRFNNNTFNYAPVEAFFNEFYYPGLVTDIFAGKRPKAPSDISQKDRRQPQLKLTLADVQSSTTLTTRNVKVKVDVTQAPAGAQDVRLFRNGSLVKVWRGDVLKGRSSVTLETTIPIVAGENRLTAYAFNRDNIKSSDAELTISGADSLKRSGTAYILAVGINEYANSQYNLRYAVADAQDFAAEMQRQQNQLGQYGQVKVISLADRDATKANILDALTTLASQVQPEDALIIYFAGHGTAQGNRFYLVPHDLGYSGSRTQLDRAALQNILAHSVSDQELERAVEGIDGGQMLLVIDACNSGQALEAEEKRRGPMNSKGLAQLAYEKGIYILTAAQSYQAAQEAARLGHGFLTYALVEEGLKTSAADRAPKDGQVLLREWLDYATERVPQMQQEKIDEQKRQGRQLEQIINFAVGDTGSERNVQRPRVFYRRETDPTPLVVARP